MDFKKWLIWLLELIILSYILAAIVGSVLFLRGLI